MLLFLLIERRIGNKLGVRDSILEVVAIVYFMTFMTKSIEAI